MITTKWHLSRNCRRIDPNRSTLASSSAASTSSSTQKGDGLLWKIDSSRATAVMVFSPPDGRDKTDRFVLKFVKPQ